MYIVATQTTRGTGESTDVRLRMMALPPPKDPVVISGVEVKQGMDIMFTESCETFAVKSVHEGYVKIVLTSTYRDADSMGNPIDRALYCDGIVAQLVQGDTTLNNAKIMKTDINTEWEVIEEGQLSE